MKASISIKKTILSYGSLSSYGQQHLAKQSYRVETVSTNNDICLSQNIIIGTTCTCTLKFSKSIYTIFICIHSYHMANVLYTFPQLNLHIISKHLSALYTNAEAQDSSLRQLPRYKIVPEYIWIKTFIWIKWK